jgi:exodeoxyribonuclease VIII
MIDWQPDLDLPTLVEFGTVAKPLVVRGLPFERYCEIDAVNQSTLQAFERSMRHGAYAVENPKAETAAMVKGSALHTMMLDGWKTFQRKYAIGGPINERTGKTYGRDTKAFEEWIAGQDRPFLTTEEYDDTLAMAEALDAHPEAGKLIRAAGGMCELTIVWNEPWGVDGQDKILCKARLDYIHPALGVLDLKTCDDCRMEQFSTKIARFRYHWQAAWYTLASKRAGLNPSGDFAWIAVESSPPHDVACWCPTDDMMTRGQSEIFLALGTYYRWVKQGKVADGPAGGIRPIDLPAWARIGDPLGNSKRSDDHERRDSDSHPF